MKHRIKQIRKYLKLSQTEFGRRLGKTLRMVQYYEAGERNIDDGVLFQLEKEFNVNSDWMKTGNGGMFNNSPKPNGVIVKNVIVGGDRSVCVPYYTDVQASAGYGAPVLSEEHEDFCIDRLVVKKSRCTIIGVLGDSMSPHLLNKDLILVDMDAGKSGRLRRGRVYVLRINDTIFVKRFIKNEGALYLFTSDNKAYPEVRLDLSDDRNALIGMVKGIVFRDME